MNPSADRARIRGRARPPGAPVTDDAAGVRPDRTGRDVESRAASVVVVRAGGVAEALISAAILGLSAVMTVLVPLVGAVRATDGAPLWFAPGALWLGLVPAVTVAALAIRRTVAALAVAAGCGLMGAARLLADLPVLTAPTALARPDLFVETTDRSLPLHAAAGGYLLLAADLVAVVAGVFAAMRLSERLAFPIGPGPQQDSAPTEAPGPAGVDPAPPPFAAFDDPPGGRPAPRRNHLLTAVGFVAVLLLAMGAMSVPYQGGYLSSRFVDVGVPLAGMVGVVLATVLAAVGVLIAGTLPRALAVALLGGAALGACLPCLVAVVASMTAPVRLSATVWVSLAGGMLLLTAGLLSRVGRPPADHPEDHRPTGARSDAVASTTRRNGASSNRRTGARPRPGTTTRATRRRDPPNRRRRR